MTNEEALNLIQHKLDLAVDDALIMTDKEYEVFSLCAKALEQEGILDKIRAEIIELRNKQNVGVLECLDIIDKYRK